MNTYKPEEFKKCPLCHADTVEHKQWLSTYIWTCTECPFLSLEYYNDQNIKELQDYLNFK